MRLVLLTLSFVLCLSRPVLAWEDLREVDLELFLAVDVSRSMSPLELEIQRKGYAAALSSEEVFAAISGGMIGQIAITYVEWAGASAQKVVIPWTVIETAEDAQAIAAKISAYFDPGLRRTSISGALDYARASIESNDFYGLRRVIDVSGDGPNNQGPLVTLARDRALADGIIINGLPLMTTDAFSEQWGIPDLDIYYSECVIGGPGAFVLPVYEWDAFPEAIKRKLILEIAGRVPETGPHVHPAAGYNCRVGEEIWARNRMIFAEP